MKDENETPSEEKPEEMPEETTPCARCAYASRCNGYCAVPPGEM